MIQQHPDRHGIRACSGVAWQMMLDRLIKVDFIFLSQLQYEYSRERLGDRCDFVFCVVITRDIECPIG
jgi:hypothetical protein